MHFNTKYDWPEIQKAYDGGLTVRELCAKFGMANRTVVLAVRRGELITRKGNAARLKSDYSFNHTTETKERISSIMQEKMANRKVASKRFEHNGVILESSWEKKLAVELDTHGIKWERPKPILYKDGEQTRRYYPDFFLPEFGVYLDPKNAYVQKLDENKLTLVRSQHTIKLLILGKDQLTWKCVKELIGV